MLSFIEKNKIKIYYKEEIKFYFLTYIIKKKAEIYNLLN